MWTHQPARAAAHPDVELEHRDRASWPDHARELPHGRGGVFHVSQQVRERHRVERAVFEGEALSLPEDGEDAVLEAGEPVRFAPGSQHRLALVQRDDSHVLPRRQPTRDELRARGDVERPTIPGPRSSSTRGNLSIARPDRTTAAHRFARTEGQSRRTAAARIGSDQAPSPPIPAYPDPRNAGTSAKEGGRRRAAHGGNRRRPLDTSRCAPRSRSAPTPARPGCR